MSNPNLEDCRYFLAQSPLVRLELLQKLGLARYGLLLSQMANTERNCTCLTNFLRVPHQVKFPNLKGAELAGLHLEGVNLIRADLTGADLRGCQLQDADLLFAKFIEADLTAANLTGATCHGTIWTDAVVQNCQFGLGRGLTSSQHQRLSAAGGKFDLIAKTS